MKKHFMSLVFLTFWAPLCMAQKDSLAAAQEKFLKEVVAFEKSIPYKTGKVDLSEKIQLNVPKGYKFIPKEQAEKIVYDYWGNPPGDGTLGMLVLENFQFMNTEDWAFILSEENEGYVKDEDADEIDYDDMLKEMQDEEEEINKQRKEAGYGPIHTVGWASKPFYDHQNKILHWAKELKFDNAKDNTLNYDVRILGRAGLLSLNAVGDMKALADVKKHIPEIIHIATFKQGHRYIDFDPAIDKVAAYTVGGLVAGKLLAKVGIFALLLKNIKLVAIAVLGGFSLVKNKILGLLGFRKKEDENPEIVAESEGGNSEGQV